MRRLTNTLVQLLQFCTKPPPSIPCLSKRGVSGPPADRGGNNHRPPIGPWPGWGHRGDVRFALDWGCSPIKGTAGGAPGPTTTSRAQPRWRRHSNQRRQVIRVYLQIRVRTAKQDLSRANSERILASASGCVPRTDLSRHCSTTMLTNAAPFLFKSRRRPPVVFSQISIAGTDTEGKKIVSVFMRTTSGKKLPPSPSRYTTSTGGLKSPGSVNSVGAGQLHGVHATKVNVGESRRAGVSS